MDHNMKVLLIGNGVTFFNEFFLKRLSVGSAKNRMVRPLKDW